MKIRVDGKYLYDVFSNFVRNNKVMFNFKTNGNYLNVQMLGDYTVSVNFPCESLDGDTSTTDCSFWVTKAINVLDKSLSVDIIITDAVMYLTQEDLSFTFIKEHEDRREFFDVSNVQLMPAYANRLKYLTHAITSCTGLAKELSISDPDPIFINGKFYADYRQTYFIDSMQYPKLCFSYNVLKDFAFRLTEKAEFYYFEESNICYFRSGMYDIWVPTMNFNIDGVTINAIDKKLNECTHVTDLCFKDYADRLLILSSAFPKQRLNLSIGENKFLFSITTNEAQCMVGQHIDKSILALNITSGQIATIAKLFKEDDTVECLRGGNCICLKSKEKNMLIAGMIY